MKGGRGRGRTDVRSMMRAANSIGGKGGKGKGLSRPVRPAEPPAADPQSANPPRATNPAPAQVVVVPSIPAPAPKPAVSAPAPAPAPAPALAAPAPKMATFTAPVRRDPSDDAAAVAQKPAPKPKAFVARRPNKMAKLSVTTEELAAMPLGDLIRQAVDGPGMKQSFTKEELAEQRRASRTPVYGYHHSAESEAEREKQLAERTLAPQVRIVDGQMVIEEQSTVHIANNFTGVRRMVENGSGRAISAWSYSGHQTSARWTQTETDRFFQALGQCGTDFSLMESFFPKPKRTRRQLHAKFKREEKLHPHLIEMALMQNVPLDHEALDDFDAPAAVADARAAKAAEEEAAAKALEPPTSALEIEGAGAEGSK